MSSGAKISGEDMMGGFFGLELEKAHKLPYEESPHCAYLSSGRAALECLLRNLPCAALRRVLVPRYCCDTLLQPLLRLGLTVERYALDETLRPLPPQDVGVNDLLLLINYFGLTGHHVESAAAHHPGPVVVDATMALYSPPLPGVATFYSLRKFGAVADGGIACAPYALQLPSATDSSAQRALCMLERTESGAVAALKSSEHAEASLNTPAKRMSTLTRRMAAAVDWQKAAHTRCRNYRILHQALGALNHLSLPDTAPAPPFCYPFFSGIPGLRDTLIEAGIALPLFWPEVIDATSATDTENRLARTLLPLPLDQRYSAADMEKLCKLIVP